jgi:uncharacterized protein (DUF1697 family)
MPTFVALLRAVNVTGTGKLPMTTLKKLCERCGYTDVKTYIASGNVVFNTKETAAAVKAKLEAALLKPMGKPCLVFVRSADELDAVVRANPYPDAHPSRMIIVFLDAAPSKDAIKGWSIPGDEEMTLIGRELFIHFPTGQGTSKLKVPFANVGTGRNLNTTRAMLALARERE